MGGFSVRLAESAAGFHQKAGVSLCIPEGAERTGIGRIPHDRAPEESVYPGAHRCREDHFDGLSGGEGGRRGTRGQDFLSDGEDDHGHGGKGSI